MSDYSKPSRAQFFWGLTAGIIAALTFVIGNDLSWHFWDGPKAAGAAQQTMKESSTRSLWLSALPEGITVEADGIPVTADSGTNVRLDVPVAAARLDLRGSSGTLWTTRLDSDYGDTLYPVLGGEIVVEVHSQGPSGELRLDGQPAGQAPGVIEDVLPGWHWISIHRDGKELFQETCFVRTGEAAGVIVPPPPPQGKGRVTVMSRGMGGAGFEPLPGAGVWLDGTLVGQTPLELTLTAGFHSVRVEHEGYNNVIDVFHLGAGLSRHVQADFGLEEFLSVKVSAPPRFTRGAPLAVPVNVQHEGATVNLAEAELMVVHDQQAEPVAVPLVPSATHPQLLVAVLPPDFLGTSDRLMGYARCRDTGGRTGVSEVFEIQAY